jgi:hypothetical protein
MSIIAVPSRLTIMTVCAKTFATFWKRKMTAELENCAFDCTLSRLLRSKSKRSLVQIVAPDCCIDG